MTEILPLPAFMTERGWTLRTSGVFDAPFFRTLFATTRSDAALLAMLPAAQREPFLDDQFRFQDIHYRNHFGGADFLVIEQRGKPAGRLILDRSTSAWQVIDIGLLPTVRGQGIGTALMQSIMDAAIAAGAASVGLHVESNNPARGLYARLGFVEIGETGFHIEMIRQLKMAS